ncbi:MAG: GntR family transcriptional regulator [Sphingobacteriaceae bacterium]|jgi:DNA-binding GntR family transcriptional regulator|nr:GntR family transcriptional regulator [Sphingobacteriaceae bacterium]
MRKEYSKLLLKSTNELLKYLQMLPDVPCGIPSTNLLIHQLNISSTTATKLIDILCEKGIVRKDGKTKIMLRKPVAADFYSLEEIENSKADLIEKQIIKKLSSYELKPSDRFSELELAKALQTNTVIIREALLKIAQSGIIKKHPRQKWEVVEFSGQMISEIAAVRKLYEGYAIDRVRLLDAKDPIWKKLEDLANRHKSLLKEKEVSAIEMREIERLFHTTIVQASNNRFIQESYNSVFTLIFFHLWQIEYDQPKIEKVLKQHLDILSKLLERKFKDATEAMVMHLDHARLSMINVNHVLDKV